MDGLIGSIFPSNTRCAGIRFVLFFAIFCLLKKHFQFSSSLKIRQLFLKDDYGLSGKDEGPKVTPVLDWVYGYRGKDSRANLDKLPTGEVSKMVSLGLGWWVLPWRLPIGEWLGE